MPVVLTAACDSGSCTRLQFLRSVSHSVMGAHSTALQCEVDADSDSVTDADDNAATPSPGWGPRGQGPSKNRQGPGKNNWTVHVKKIEKDQMAINPVLSVFHGGWSRRLSHTHSYPGCHAPARLIVALADHGCSQYTSIAAYDYS